MSVSYPNHPLGSSTEEPTSLYLQVDLIGSSSKEPTSLYLQVDLIGSSSEEPTSLYLQGDLTVGSNLKKNIKVFNEH